MTLARVYNNLWMASCFREARAFARDSRDVRATQAALLRRLLRRHENTWFGRKHRFASIHNAPDFQNAVPLSDYEDYRDAIARISNGEQNLLTADRVHLLEPTSGSTSGEKLIPYTSGLRRSFRRAIRTWIWDLYSQRPAVRHGRSYWSITPLLQLNRRTTAGIPIGFEDDASYLSTLERHFVQSLMVVPPTVARCGAISTAQYATLFFLMRAADLSLISVWSPTFLSELLQLLWANWERLVADVAVGRLAGCNLCEQSEMHQQYQPLPERAEKLRQIFRRANHISDCVPLVWPALALVSCWADGPSKVHARNLCQNLSKIEIQPKGLLATEAFVTVPFVSAAAAALMVRSHFFEFQPVNSGQSIDDFQPLLSHELTRGRCYRVIVTTEGGLYRYKLYDEVEVTGFVAEVPLLRFVGKADDVSDLVGEKLDAAHVEKVLQSAFLKLHLSPRFFQLRGEQSFPPGYALELSFSETDIDASVLAQLQRIVEHGLCSNPGYRYARAMGQLRNLNIGLLNQRQVDAIIALRAIESCAAGQRLGDVKPITLVR
jgi:hypothetical protein